MNLGLEFNGIDEYVIKTSVAALFRNINNMPKVKAAIVIDQEFQPSFNRSVDITYLFLLT